MQILWLLAARRAATSTIIASPVSERREDEGDFFDLDFSSCSVRASSSSSGRLSFSDSDDDGECTELDFIISLQRSSSASPHFFRGGGAGPLKFCASEPPTSKAKAGRRRGTIGGLRTLSFGARNAATLHGRPSFARRFARSSSGSARSFRLFVDSLPRATTDEDERHAAGQTAPSRDVLRRCLANISRRLRTSARGLRRLRKCRSASSAPRRLGCREAGRHRRRHRALQGVAPPSFRVRVRLAIATVQQRPGET